MLSEANFIEGIGDEVVVLLGVCLLFFTIFLVWMSTQVNWDNQPIRVFVFRATQVQENAAVLPSVEETTIPETQREQDGLDTVAPQTIEITPEHTTASTSRVQTVEAVSNDNNDQMPTVNSLILRLKYFDERQKVVSANPSESITDFKKRCFQQELADNKTVRLIFNGRELKEGECLHSYGLTDDATIHCLVTRRAPIEEGSNAGSTGQDSQSDEMDISGLMFPTFGVILGVIWYCRVSYRQYFNVLSTFALVGITVLFFVAAFTCWTFRVRQQEFHREENNPRVRHINVSS